MALHASYRAMTKYLGLGATLRSLAAGVAVKKCPDLGETKKLLDAKHHAIARELRKIVAPAIEKNRVQAPCAAKNDGCIYMYWQQGLRNAPDRIRESVKSIERFSNGRPVCVLDEASLGDLVKIPDILSARMRAGQIHPAHAADFARMLLLRDCGGLWVDASFFAARPIPQSTFEIPFFSPHSARDNTRRYPSDSRWVIGLMGGAQGHVIFRYMADAFSEYWTHCDGAVCPLLTDYLLRIGYEEIESIRAAVDALPENGAHIYDLAARGADVANPAELAALATDTFLFRFPWRESFPETTPDGKPTWFGYLCSLNEQ